MAIEIGTRGATNQPCKVLNLINCSRLCEAQHSVEETIIPETQLINKFLRLKRDANHPDAGVTTAVATMLKVIIRAI